MSKLRGFSEFVLNHKIWVVVLSLATTFSLAIGITRMNFSSDYRVYFSDTNPQLQAFELLQSTYTKNDSILFVITPKNGNLFSPIPLQAIEELTEKAWTLPYSARVDSITNFQHTQANGDELIVGSLIENPLQMSQEELAKAKSIALSEPLLRNQLISSNGEVTGVNVMVELPGKDHAKEVPEAVNAARALQQQFQLNYPNLEFRLTGQVVNNYGFMEISKSDLENVMPLAFSSAILCIALFMYMASGKLTSAIAGTAITVLVTFLSIGSALGIAGWLGINLSTVTVSSPTIILTLAVADCIHIMMTFLQRLQSGFPASKAMEESLRINFKPVFLTSLTTIIGFLSMNFSDSPPFKDLGNIVAIGVLFAWFYAITLLPALALLLPFKTDNHHWERELMNKLADLVIKYRLPIFSIVLVWIVFSLSFVMKNELNDQWSKYFDDSLPLRQDGDYTNDHLTGLGRLNFSLSAGKENGITDPAYLNSLEAFAQWLAVQPEVVHVSSFSEVIKRLNKNMHYDDPEWFKIPDDPVLASQYLLLYEMSLPFGLDLNNQVNIDRSATRLTASLQQLSTSDLLALQERAKAWQQINLPPSMFHEGSSPDVMFAHIGYRNIRSMLWGTLTAVILISIILTIALKSLKYGLISLALNLAPAGIAFGIWGFWVGHVGLGLSVVAGVTLGIVVDYNVHFLTKYISARRERNMNAIDGVHYAFRSVGIALVVTTAILCANFSLMGLSDFQLNADFGFMTAGTIIISLIIDFFFLPPLLIFSSRVIHK